MTYNEFMKQFDEFVNFKIEMELNKFGTAREAAKHFDTSESTLSRIRNHVGRCDKSSIKLILGDDIYDQEVKPLDDLKIEYYEKELQILRAKKRINKEE